VPGAANALVKCNTLAAEERLSAARLAADAMAALYRPLGEEALPVLADEFLIEGSELGDSVALMNSTVEGLIASYPAAEYQSRQRVSLHHALSELSREAGERLVEQLRALASQIPQDRIEGEYLARFAVRPDLRGSGRADRLMDYLVSSHPKISLHVRTDNGRAVSFYRRHGFVDRSDGGGFLMMQRG